MMSSNLVIDQQYKDWLVALKHKVRDAQITAVVSVNRELLMLYWELGAEIVVKQANTKWGSGFLQQLSQDLRAEFPELKGLSRRNLAFMRQWYLFYHQHANLASDSIVQQPVTQLALNDIDNWNAWVRTQITQIPWGHNIAIITKCKDHQEALYYVQNTIQHNWSRAVLVHQIESRLYEREGKAPNLISRPSASSSAKTKTRPLLSMRYGIFRNPLAFLNIS